MGDNSLTVTLSASTLNILKRDGYRFYVFRAVASSNRSGVPLVCHSFDNYLNTITVGALPSIAGYLSTTPVASDATILINASQPVHAGQLVRVSKSGGMDLYDGTSADAVQFTSQSDQRYTCGLAVSSTPQVPFCAFDLYMGTVVPISPLPGVLVMFATSHYTAGAYMQNALGDGLYVNMSDSVPRNVTYDIATGWQFEQAAWAHGVSAGSSLVESLIQRPQKNSPRL